VTTRIRAAVCRRFGAPLSIEHLDLADPGVGEVRVEIETVGVCHSDLHFQAGDYGGALPAVYGHEAAGVVAAVGEGVTRPEVGDHVVVTLIRPCHECRNCRRGVEVECTTRFPLDERSPLSSPDGSPVWAAMRCGAFAEQVVVGASQTVVIPADLGWDQAALLACGVITGVGAVRTTAAVEPDDSVAVIGAGGVGLNAVQGARLAGADPIVVVDPSPQARAAAIEFGATHAVAPVDAAGAIDELTDGALLDHAVVTVGVAAAYAQALDLLAPAGTLVLVGLPATDDTFAVSPTNVASQSQRLLGSSMGSSRISTDIPQLIDAYREGRLMLDELVSAVYPFDDINDAIDAVHRGGLRRAVVRMR